MSCLWKKYFRKQQKSDENEIDEEEEPSIVSRRPQSVRIPDMVPEMAINRTGPVVPYVNSNVEESSEEQIHQSTESKNSKLSWSEDEKQLLCKTIVRFPPGTARRWEKVAEVLGRPVSQVIHMAKQIQNTVGTNPINVQDHSSILSTATKIEQHLITERENPEVNVSWSKTDQQLLECALKTVPKDIPGVDRWEQIALCIPGKTREDCLARYRHIAQLVRAKKAV